MNTDIILRLLKNSGFNVLGVDGTSIYLEDPSCILRSFTTFVEYAWIIISVITAILLFGWAISMIRGAKNDIFTNMRNLVLIFGTLAAAGPIVNFIWGDDLFARGCRTIQVSIADVNKLLDARKLQLGRDGGELYEEFDIYDSGAPNEIPYSDMPVPSAGNVDEMPTVEIPSKDSSAGGSTSKTEPPAPPKENVTPPAPPAAPAAARPNHAVASGRDVVYTTANGTKYKRTGGSRAWRNTNPGNIRYSEFARRMGAIGQAGGFAVFPDEESGMGAISALLRSDSYNKLTVAGAISRYAPPHENDTAAYHRKIKKMTGLDINRKISELSDDELARVASAIRTVEGWTPGRTVKA